MMKKLLLLAACFIQISAFSQPKKANTIIVESKIGAAENYKLAIDALTSSDLLIASESERQHMLKSDLNNDSRNRIQYYLILKCTDDKITISGMFKNGISIEMYGVRAEDTFCIIENRGGKGSAYNIAFKEMLTFAQSFGLPLSYIAPENKPVERMADPLYN